VTTTTTTTADVTRDSVRVLLDWLRNTAQPDGAITQDGPDRRITPDRSLSLHLIGYQGKPVLAINVSPAHWEGTGANHRCVNGLRNGELQELAAIVAEFVPVGETWNGEPGSDTGSIQLDCDPHPTLIAARQRYALGCPTHQHVFCHREGCGWFSQGAELIVHPTFAEEAPERAEDPAWLTPDEPEMEDAYEPSGMCSEAHQQALDALTITDPTGHPMRPAEVRVRAHQAASGTLYAVDLDFGPFRRTFPDLAADQARAIAWCVIAVVDCDYDLTALPEGD
jgi:hypothetical protein